VLVTPTELKSIIRRRFADLTSRSLRKANRRGTLVVPAESEWIIKHWAADLTSRSLRKRTRQARPSEAHPTNASLRYVNNKKGRRSSDRRPGSEEGRQFGSGYWVIPSFSSSSSAMMMRGVTIIIRLWVSRPTPTFLNSRFT